MSTESEKLREARAALKSMSSKKNSKMTKQRFVTNLINDIHAKMKEGFQLDEICEQINMTLPESDRIKLSTFRAYVRTAREDTGIKPLRTWTRRDTKGGNVAKTKVNNEVEKKQPIKAATQNEFRNMGGDL